MPNSRPRFRSLETLSTAQQENSIEVPRAASIGPEIKILIVVIVWTMGGGGGKRKGKEGEKGGGRLNAIHYIMGRGISGLFRVGGCSAHLLIHLCESYPMLLGQLHC